MRRRAGEWLCSAAAGLAALGAVRVLGPWLGFAVRIGPPALAVAGVLGLPGAAGLLLARLLLFAG
jgi:hypothetical protein